MERALAAQSPIARILVRLFQTQFAPGGEIARGRAPNARRRASATALDKVTSLDDDRILRAYLAVIRATLRTNYYQLGRCGRHAEELRVVQARSARRSPSCRCRGPSSRSSSTARASKACTCAWAYVARGGLRWSDRREDFRTEVLGLMKAQNVKNTVIVPVGAKGGFVPKRLPAGGSREEVQAEGIACYQTFIRGLLDVTDNIVNGKIVARRRRVVRRDGDDAYLVVAADKGTATFSDIANAISIEYGFWLGDAFASGGSAGYDHKKMGITARGAWECVKRQFREIGTDIQTTGLHRARASATCRATCSATACCSRGTSRLRRHSTTGTSSSIPNPDRGGELPRARALVQAAALDLGRLRPQVDLARRRSLPARGQVDRAARRKRSSMLGLDAAAAPPNDVIRAILRMPVDLLWNGGIGTYVKASEESHAEVGDRTNDAVRVNGRELRAKVVGEGGNLGCTQRGRVEYALAGGRINTDFIDNSARRQHLGRRGEHQDPARIRWCAAASSRAATRNKLLRRMTKEVAALVLRNNYLQSQALSARSSCSRVRRASRNTSI